MAISPLPPYLWQAGRRPFSFYPPIRGIEHNQWLYGSANWSEVQVVNTHSGAELWIPRRFLGEVSRVEDPVLIVGLKRELEYKQGAVRPHRSRVIEMPLPANESHSRQPSAHPHLAPVINIRLEPSQEGRAVRSIVVVVVLSVVACSIVVGVARSAHRPRLDRAQLNQSYLQLNREDDYPAVIRKLGAPGGDRRWKGPNEVTYRALAYPERHFTVILCGRTEASIRYAGTLDRERRVLDWAPGAGSLP